MAVTLLAVLAAQYLTRGDDKPGDLRSQITARMITVLEQTPPEQHHGHGAHAHVHSHLRDDEPRTICAARVFGFEPPDASRLSDVRVVYGHHLCAMAQKGLPWDVSPKLVGPVVLDLTASPPRVEVAAATEDMSFTERTRQLMPERYHEEALKEFLEPESIAELRRRYDSLAS